MPLEIERRFLVHGDDWRGGWMHERFCQGHLTRDDAVTVRVRRAGARAFLTIKGAARGAVRQEFEYEIPVEHAEEMLDTLCHKPLVEKTRHHVPHAGRRWLVDEFAGDNAGLVLAEIELADPHERFAPPSWLGAEITDDPRYRNSFLARRPFRTWRDVA